MSTKHNYAGAGDEPEVVTSIRLTRAQHDALRLLAASQHRSISQQVRFLVENAVALEERKAA